MKLQTILLGAAGLFFAVLVFLFSCTGARQDLVVSPPFTIAGADYVGMETCGFCHEELVRDFKYTDHSRLTISLKEGFEIPGCEACHGPGSLHVEAGGGLGEAIINPEQNPSSCFQCHPTTKVLFSLQYHHPVREGRLTCISCHDPHGANILLPKGTFVGRVNETCFGCHREQARPYVFEHEALREGCTICHQPHGSINDKLLIERDSNLCIKCHAQLAVPGTIVFGDTNHTGFVMQGVCWSAGCHTAVHGSDINSSLRY
jgi:predicted CXXCH cytochrome family protein